MKKTISILVVLLLLLPPALGSASYLIRLKNGRQVATPMYWFEGQRIFFYTAGGIAGMERSEIAGVESDEAESNLDAVMINKGKGEKGLPPAFSPTQKPQKQPSSSQAKESEEKIDLKAYKNTKDQMVIELDGLMEKLREATSRKDNEAKEKIKEEIREKSGQIYQLTDEVTKKNKGMLPEGWWKK